MGGCSIRKCKIRSVKGGSVRFFTIPKNEAIANEWLKYCSPNTKRQNGKVCSEHFKPSDYVLSLRHVLMNEPHKMRLGPDAVPTLHLNGHNVVEKEHKKPNKKKIKKIEGNFYIEEDSDNTESQDKTISNGIVQQDTNTADNKSILKKVIINVDANIGDGSHNTEHKEQKKNTGNIKSILKKENHTEDSFDYADYLSVSDNTEIDTSFVERKVKVSFEDDEKSDDDTIPITLAEYKQLQKTAKQHTDLKNNLTKIFTRGQIRVLMDPERSRIQWAKEDISSAIWLLRNIRPHAYHHLKFNYGLPLPAFSTLRNWASKHKVEVTSLPSAEHDYLAINIRDFSSLEPKRDRKVKKKVKGRVKPVKGAVASEADITNQKPKRVRKVRKKVKPENQPVEVDETAEGATYLVIQNDEASPADYETPPKPVKRVRKVKKKEKPVQVEAGDDSDEANQAICLIVTEDGEVRPADFETPTKHVKRARKVRKKENPAQLEVVYESDEANQAVSYIVAQDGEESQVDFETPPIQVKRARKVRRKDNPAQVEAVYESDEANQAVSYIVTQDDEESQVDFKTPSILAKRARKVRKKESAQIEAVYESDEANQAVSYIVAQDGDAQHFEIQQKPAKRVKKKDNTAQVEVDENVETTQPLSYITIQGEDGTSRVVSLITIQEDNGYQQYAILGGDF